MSNADWMKDPRREKSIYDDDIYEPSPDEPQSRGDVIEKRWAFCPITGQLLILDGPKEVARSEKCDFSRPLSVSSEPGVAGWGAEWPGRVWACGMRAAGRRRRCRRRPHSSVALLQPAAGPHMPTLSPPPASSPALPSLVRCRTWTTRCLW